MAKAERPLHVRFAAAGLVHHSPHSPSACSFSLCRSRCTSARRASAACPTLPLTTTGNPSCANSRLTAAHPYGHSSSAVVMEAADVGVRPRRHVGNVGRCAAISRRHTSRRHERPRTRAGILRVHPNACGGVEAQNGSIVGLPHCLERQAMPAWLNATGARARSQVFFFVFCSLSFSSFFLHIFFFRFPPPSHLSSSLRSDSTLHWHPPPSTLPRPHVGCGRVGSVNQRECVSV